MIVSLFCSPAPAAPVARVELYTALHREVTGTSGAYEGYRDELRSTGRFVLEPGLDGVTVQARYDWIYTGPDSPTDQGELTRTVRVDAASRLYLDRCDLDDYDHLPATSLSTWLWVPLDLQVGSSVQVLDRRGTVAAIEDLPVDGQPVPAFRIEMSGSEPRTDDYGVMTIAWQETWWFETSTGLFLKSRFVDEATGTVEGEAGGFRRVEEALRRPSAEALPVPSAPVSAAPTPVATSWEEEGQSEGSTIFCILGNLIAPFAIIGGYLLNRRLARRPRDSVRVPGAGTVEIAEVRDPDLLRGLVLADGPVAAEGGGPTHPLLPILPDLARRALAVGGRVQVARLGSRAIGLGISEPVPAASNAPAPPVVGTAWAADGPLRRALIYNLGLVSWFAPTSSRQKMPDTVRTIETWTVLQLQGPAGRRWDTDLVRRIKPADHGAVVELLSEDLGASASAWLEAQLTDGDLAWVAVVQGRVVGCALAGMHGTLGRLHGICVHPDHRGRGIGAELVAARIDALALLGAERVIVEISHHNPASLHLARKAGFVPVGSFVIESRSTSPSPPRSLSR